MIKQYQTGRFLKIYDLTYRIIQYSQNKSLITKDGFTTQCLAACAENMDCRGAYVRHTANLRFCTLMHDLGTCTPSIMGTVPFYLATGDESESWYRANQMDTPTPAGCGTTTTTTAPGTVSTLSVGGYGYVLAAQGLGIDPSTVSEAVRQYQTGRFHSFIYDTDAAVRIEQFKHNQTTFNKDEFTLLCLTQCSAYTANMTAVCRGAYVRHTTNGNRVCTLLQELGTCTPSMMETVPLFLSTTDISESWWLSGQVDPATCSL